MATNIFPDANKKRVYALIDNYFSIAELKSSLATEILAGVSTYLSLAAVFILNPSILSTTGMNISGVLFATVVAGGLSTLLMGLWARIPFAVAPES